MQRSAILSLIILVAAPAAAATANAGPSARSASVRAGSGSRRSGVAVPAPPRSRLAGFACHTAIRQSRRSVSVRAVMRPLTGTEKMQMRFELLSKPTAGAAFASQPGAGLGSWISPADPTLGQRRADVWIVSHPVSDLPAPAFYRYRVSFRWTGAGGRVLATRTRSSADCYQPVFLPDLIVSSIALQSIANKPKQDRYQAVIGNAGVGPTPGPFAVSFTPGASMTPGVPPPATITKTLPSLAAGATTTVTFLGPACTAATAPTVVVDPDHSVDESGFASNSLTVDPSCPPLSSAPATTPPLN